MKYMKISSNIS